VLNAAHVVLQVAIAYHILVSSPRAWGCFRYGLAHREVKDVFPTRVGVFPSGVGERMGKGGLPHARGGVSKHSFFLLPVALSSPRAWGWF
jgi:hypothetical protein